jgi:hypothetical protein
MTAMMKTSDMQGRPSKSGLCIVRIEAESEHVLITVTTDTNIGSNLRLAPSERIIRTTGIEEAMAIVEQFLRSF